MTSHTDQSNARPVLDATIHETSESPTAAFARLNDIVLLPRICLDDRRLRCIDVNSHPTVADSQTTRRTNPTLQPTNAPARTPRIQPRPNS